MLIPYSKQAFLKFFYAKLFDTTFSRDFLIEEKNGWRGGSSIWRYKWKWKSLSHVWLFVTPWTIQSMNSPGQNTGMGSLSFLQGIFPTQVSNPGLPYCRRILYQLSHNWSPRILEWVGCLFSSGSSQQNEKETYWMGKKILANHISEKGLISKNT